MNILKIGDSAPLFCANDQYDQNLCLNSLKGKKVILYFYPRDNTPTCIKQACALRDNYSQLQKSGFIILGISMDGLKSHNNFSKKFNLPFQLLSDEDGRIVNLYGVYGEKQFMGRNFLGIHRTTFVIDEEGVISYIIRKVKSSEHHLQILNHEQE